VICNSSIRESSSGISVSVYSWVRRAIVGRLVSVGEEVDVGDVADCVAVYVGPSTVVVFVEG
jgi:hypothetical protein